MMTTTTKKLNWKTHCHGWDSRQLKSRLPRQPAGVSGFNLWCDTRERDLVGILAEAVAAEVDCLDDAVQVAL